MRIIDVTNNHETVSFLNISSFLIGYCVNLKISLKSLKYLVIKWSMNIKETLKNNRN